jgi:rhamnosyltransferase subunit B
VGLPAIDSASYQGPHVVAQAAMFPEWFGMPAKDWPDLECLGFPLPPCAEPLPPPVLAFLERCPRPLVFTTGTGVGNPGAFFDAAARCCAELGMPGIFLSPFLGNEQPALPPHIARFDHVELEPLLPHAALMVHHGGMGTTARALQAGIPQIISPIGFDQPDNGHRVELLGAGRVVPRDGMSGATFAAAARELLGDAQTAAKLSSYRAALAAPRAVDHAADLLERVAVRSAIPSWDASLSVQVIHRLQQSHNSPP